MIAGLVFASLAKGDVAGRYVVIAPPWWSLSETIKLVGDADGAVVDVGRAPNTIFAASSNPEFLRDARRSGALIALRSSKLAGCFGGPAARSRA